MKKTSRIALLFCALLASCSSKVVKKNNDHEQTRVTFSPLYSVIEGKVVDITNPNIDLPVSSPCHNNACRASIEIVQIIQKGQNYHGQFHSGDTLEIDFTFTLSPTNNLFPELNNPLPGLKKEEQFVAQLYEKKDSDRPYRVKLYEVKEE